METLLNRLNESINEAKTSLEEIRDNVEASIITYDKHDPEKDGKLIARKVINKMKEKRNAKKGKKKEEYNAFIDKLEKEYEEKWGK